MLKRWLVYPAWDISYLPPTDEQERVLCTPEWVNALEESRNDLDLNDLTEKPAEGLPIESEP